MAKLKPPVDAEGDVRELTVTVRLDADVVEFFRIGDGWQTRLNAFLAAHVKRASKRKPAKSGHKVT